MTYQYGKYLGEIDECVGDDGLFNGDYVKQVKSASNRLFDDMCAMSGVLSSYNLTTSCLNKSKITKPQLIEWLYSNVFLLDRCSIPLMTVACDQREELDELKNEKIIDQKKIIEMQDKLIEKKDVELSSVQKTLETELKSYSSVVEKSCTAALAPQKIANVVRTVSEGDERKKNLVVFGIAEEQTEELNSKVNGLLEQLHEKPQIIACSRVGNLSKSGTTRPIKFTLRSSDIAYQILRKAKLLKDIEGFQSVYISPDRTVEEQKDRRELVVQLKKKRQTDQSTRYIIKKGQIVSVAK